MMQEIEDEIKQLSREEVDLEVNNTNNFCWQIQSKNESSEAVVKKNNLFLDCNLF